MKRFLLIAAGTVSGLGAVLSITPPQLNAANLGSGLGIGTLPTTGVSTQTPATGQSKPSATPTATSTPTTRTIPSQSVTKSSTPTPTQSASASASSSSSATPTHSQSTTPNVEPTIAPTPTVTPTKSATPTPTKTTTPTPTPTIKSINGTFTGPSVNVNYGNVQVEITVSNGKITDARALQSPSGRSDRYSQFALPLLKQQTLAAQSTNIQGASGASYTTYGWRKSLQGAMAKAGL